MKTGDRVAAIDIGTNSVLLLVAEARQQDGLLDLIAIEERATITRLGEGVDRTRELSAAASERTLVCLQEYARVLAGLSVRKLAAVGTSAMRDARGGSEFRARAAAILGVEPTTISGDEEARLTFRGGLSGLTLDAAAAADVLVFDIGGGSTELIRGAANQAAIAPLAAVSLDVGSVRLTERHVRSDPPTADELQAVREDIDRALAAAPAIGTATLIGVAGTVTTLAAIARQVDPYDAARIHGLTLERREVEEVLALLSRLPSAQRQLLPGLSPKRADVIVAGASLCERILARAQADRLIVSDRGVRWGLALELAAGLEP